MADAKAELAKAVPGIDALLEQGKLRILDFSGWYTSMGGMRSNERANVWLEEERAALAEGYEGLRISGNTSFLTSSDWDDFIEYEGAACETFRGRRIVALCSYGGQHSGAVEKLEVVRSHHCAIHRTDSHWQVLT